jgi:hypothetical protein
MKNMLCTMMALAMTITLASTTSASPTLVKPTVAPIVYTDPACTAKLVSTGPAIVDAQGGTVCPAADPYVGQKRYAGYIENGTIRELEDQGQSGAFHCRPSPIVGGAPICTKDADRVIEETCTATLTYECPCGISFVTVEGGRQAAQCNRVK